MRSVLIVVGAGVVALIALLIVRSATDRPDDVLRNEAALTWVVRAAGGLVAAVAAFALLARALDGVPAERLVGLVLPLLGGVLLSAGHWAVALSLAAVAVALIVVRRAGWGSPPPESPPSAD